MHTKRLAFGAAGAGAVLAALAGLFLWLWGGEAGAQGGSAELSIVDFAFEPTSQSVALGTTVTFTNNGERPHTVTDRGGTFDTQPIEPGQNAPVTFTVPGKYSIFCRINPSRMNATIEVEPGAEPAKVVRIQAVDDGNIQGETLRFDPPNLSVEAGTTLIFANVGGKPHTITAEDGSFTSGVVPPGPEQGKFAGGNATFTVASPGTFNFFCDIHPQAMKGVLTVRGAEVAGGPAPPSAGARTATVAMADFEFREKQVSVAPGATITFDNGGAAPHTATLDEVEGIETPDTGQVAPGASGTLTAPAQPGSYSYRCTIHPARMRGVIVVLGQSTADPAAQVATTAPPGGGEQANATPGATAAPSRPTDYTATAGVSGGMKTWIVITLLVGAFLAGVGITPFLRRRSA